MSTPPPQGPPPQGPNGQGPPPQGPPGRPSPQQPGYPQHPNQPYPYRQQQPPQQQPNQPYPYQQGYGGYSPGPPGNGPKRRKRLAWMLGGGAFVLVVLIVGVFIGLNALSKSSSMSHEVVAMGPGDEPTEDGSSPAPSESPSPTPSESTESSSDYGTGSCINGDSTTVITVDCDEAHLAQIYYEHELPGGEYPDKAAFEAAAKRICPKHVKGAVDSGTVTSNYRISWLAPDRTKWESEDDHHIYCLVMRKDGKHFTGTKLLTQ